MSFPRYPKYKPSGVDWLGEVPEHWDTMLLKRAFRAVDYGVSDSLEPGGTVRVLRMGNIAGGRILAHDLKYVDTVDPQLLLSPNDLLYNRTNSLDLIGKVGLFEPADDTPTSFASYLVRLRVGANHDPRYFSYLLNTEGLLAIARSSAFVAIGQCNLNPTRYLQIAVALPPCSEQRTIAAFLDEETAKIDALVAEQEHLIELLKEKRQAVISHAVTKGLDPSALMKPSGIDWIGNVPAHWEVSSLKRAFRSVDYGISEALDPEGRVAILRMGNIDNGRITMDDLKYTPDVDPALVLGDGDLLYNRTNSLEQIGKVGVFEGQDSRVPVSFASYLVRLRVRMGYAAQYFAYLLNTESILAIARSSAFVAIGQCNLNPTRYLQISAAIPPASEQAQIVGHLDRETTRLDSLLEETKHGITLLQERRTALISAAVTGQIDVRAAAARLTQEPQPPRTRRKNAELAEA